MYAIIKETRKFRDELISEGFYQETADEFMAQFFERRLIERSEAGTLCEEKPGVTRTWNGAPRN